MDIKIMQTVLQGGDGFVVYAKFTDTDGSEVTKEQYFSGSSGNEAAVKDWMRMKAAEITTAKQVLNTVRSLENATFEYQEGSDLIQK